MSIFYERLISLCQERGIAPSSLGSIANIPVSPASITRYQNGAVPRNSTVKAIADYFKVDVAYLLGDEDDPSEGKVPPTEADCASCPCKNVCSKSTLSPKEHQIINMYRSLSELGKMEMESQVLAIWKQSEARK